VIVWAARYGQQAWLRQLERPVSREQENAALRTVAIMDGTPFPSTTRLASRWLKGRLPDVKGRLPGLKGRFSGRRPADPSGPETALLETAYCAEVVAVTYEAMGLLPGGRRPNWYDPGRFWSGDDLELTRGGRLGKEIAVRVPATRP
jgi:hypothetical protein